MANSELSQLVMHLRRATKDAKDDVIDIEQQVSDIISIFTNKERHVGFCCHEAMVADVRSKPLVPCPRSLLETVQKLLQKAPA
jgi:hypothetical protein